MKHPHRTRLIICTVTLLSVLCLCVWAQADAPINETTFPDSAFREYVRQFDTNGDAILDSSELTEAKDISVSNMGITTLKGIEHFTALLRLTCDCNKLSDLDISGNNSLEWLSCSSNRLTSLDITNNIKLRYVICDNNQLTELDTTKNPELYELVCWQNKLKKLDVSQNLLLKSLFCGENELTALDISRNTALINLNCITCQIKTFDISQNTLLETCYVSNNLFTEFDASHNPALKTLDCGCTHVLNNLKLGTISSLEKLHVQASDLTDLDISLNTGLKELHCDRNPHLASLDITHNPALVYLLCNATALTSLDISQNPTLDQLVQKQELSWFDPWNIYGWWYPRTENIDSAETYLFIDRGICLITTGGTIVTEADQPDPEPEPQPQPEPEPEPEPTSVTVKGGIYELNAKKTAAIFTGPEKKNAKTLVIQDTVKINGKQYKVTEVAAGACKGMSKLTTLTIGKNVKAIGKQAFYKCKKAKTIKILGTALKTIGKNAFGGGYSKPTVYCAKKKIKAYTKLLQKASLSKKAVFKELK